MNRAEDIFAGERVRIEHALTVVDAYVHSLRIALRDPGTPLGLDGTQGLVQAAVIVAVHAAAADAALRLRGAP